MKMEGLRIAGYMGTWYVIATKVDKEHGTVHLLEHELYGDSAASLIVDENLTVIAEDVWNGFDDLA